MRNNFQHLDQYRINSGMFASPNGASFGAFQCNDLRIISSGSESEMGTLLNGFEHVSVSCAKRTPMWEEMYVIKDMFWDDEECVIQYFPPKSQYVNVHQYCLHMWRPIGATIPIPPRHLLA